MIRSRNGSLLVPISSFFPCMMRFVGGAPFLAPKTPVVFFVSGSSLVCSTTEAQGFVFSSKGIADKPCRRMDCTTWPGAAAVQTPKPQTPNPRTQKKCSPPQTKSNLLQKNLRKQKKRQKPKTTLPRKKSQTYQTKTLEKKKKKLGSKKKTRKQKKKNFHFPTSPGSFIIFANFFAEAMSSVVTAQRSARAPSCRWPETETAKRSGKRRCWGEEVVKKG